MGEVRRKKYGCLHPHMSTAGIFCDDLYPSAHEGSCADTTCFCRGGRLCPPCGVLLTPLGSIVRECLERLSDDAAGISVDKYVIMPNHIHVIICIDGEKGGQSRPPLQRLMQRFKSITTRRAWNMGYTKLWQRSYYDHAIRNDADYLRTWQYIHDNPARWAEDEYYSE